MSAVLSILEAVMNSLWQAAIVAALVWLALRFLPSGIAGFKAVDLNAATRYAIWWAALAVVLILPVAPAALRAMRTHPAATAPTTAGPARPSLVLDRPTEPVLITVTPERTARWPLVIVAVWAAILLFRLGQITRSYFYLRGVKQRAEVSLIPLPSSARRADLLISGDIASPMAVGFARPAVILPASLLDELSEPEREHVLLHEMAHLAGYDDWSNLAMRLLGAALALHPIAIWILRRIEREREMVCDDWVVARTSDARPYAATLARLFELRWSRRSEALAPGLFGRGTSVGNRIESLLRRGRKFSPRVSEIDVTAGLLALGILLLGSALVPRWISLAQQNPAISFEVASIHPNASGSPDSVVNLPDTGRLSATNATLEALIRAAWVIQNMQIIGGPKWIDADRFDIEAKTSRPIRDSDDGPLLQNLLAERFHLKVHQESRNLPAYALRVTKNGRKFPEHKGDTGSIHTSRGAEKISVTAERFTMSQLAGILGRQVGRVVQDKTGLRGYYDFSLEWDPGQTPDSQTPSIFSALEEQLGLKLEASRGSVPVLVIDHAEKPDAN
jgi:uncharacterized protein (TIGR03435 family)